MSKPEDYNWDVIFDGAGWFHTTGITPALSETMPPICEDAYKSARKQGAIISCDLNYRKNLWSSEQAQKVMKKLAGMVDIIIGNEEDAEKMLGIVPAETKIAAGELNYDAYVQVAKKICESYGVKQVAFTLRSSKSASDNTWAGMLYNGKDAYFSRNYDIHIVDRVGGGDSFSAGLIYGMLKGMPPKETVEFATAASCLKHTMEFDFNHASVEDVMLLMSGDGSGRVQR